MTCAGKGLSPRTPRPEELSIETPGRTLGSISGCAHVRCPARHPPPAGGYKLDHLIPAGAGRVQRRGEPRHQPERGSFDAAEDHLENRLDAEARAGRDLGAAQRDIAADGSGVDRCVARAGTPNLFRPRGGSQGVSCTRSTLREKKLYERLSFGLPPVPARHLY